MTTGSRVLWFASLAALVGCAAAGSAAEQGHEDAAVDIHHDAHVALQDSGKPADAEVPHDASVLVDADEVMPDAAPEPLICTDNAQCDNPGDCCLTLGEPDGFCVAGTILIGVCLPN